MTRLTDTLRGADPARDLDLPRLDDRAEQELTALIGSAPQGPGDRKRSVPRSRLRALCSIAVPALVAAAVIGVSTLILVNAHSWQEPPSSSNMAQRVRFAVPASEQAASERVLEDGIAHPTNDAAHIQAFARVVRSSPQLRVDQEHDGSALDAPLTAHGPHRFDVDDTADIDGEPVGGDGTGADTVQIIAVHCTGSGLYHWTLLGHTAGTTKERIIATATGPCAPGVTAARFVLHGDTVRSTLDVTTAVTNTYSIAAITYAGFSTPRLDNPDPTPAVN